MADNRAFKQRISQPQAILLPGVADPLAALCAQSVGCEALYVTGAGVSNTMLGMPDLGFLNLSDMASTVERIAGVCGLPLVVDADTGYGNVVNTYHAVRRLEAAGASVIQLEDQVFPKRCGHFEGKEVVSTSEMLDKIKAAVDARRDENTLIMARTDSAAIHGYEAAIERAQAFAEAGADILFVEAVTTLEQIRQTPQRVSSRPHLINIVFGGKTPALSVKELEETGYKFVLYANAALQASVYGIKTVLGSLQETGSLEKVADRLEDFSGRQAMVKTAEWDALRSKYEGGDN